MDNFILAKWLHKTDVVLYLSPMGELAQISEPEVMYQPLKVDKSKLSTIKNYAKSMGLDRTTIYRWITEGKIKHIEIDGVFFIEKK